MTDITNTNIEKNESGFITNQAAIIDELNQIYSGEKDNLNYQEYITNLWNYINNLPVDEKNRNKDFINAVNEIYQGVLADQTKQESAYPTR